MCCLNGFNFSFFKFFCMYVFFQVKGKINPKGGTPLYAALPYLQKQLYTKYCATLSDQKFNCFCQPYQLNHSGPLQLFIVLISLFVCEGP